MNTDFKKDLKFTLKEAKATKRILMKIIAHRKTKQLRGYPIIPAYYFEGLGAAAAVVTVLEKLVRGKNDTR